MPPVMFRSRLAKLCERNADRLLAQSGDASVDTGSIQNAISDLFLASRMYQRAVFLRLSSEDCHKSFERMLPSYVKSI